MSVSTSGAQGQGGSRDPGTSILSGDGRYVVFQSDAPNLVPGDTNGATDIFVRDRQAGTTERVSVDSAGSQCNADCIFASISSDGRFVAFDSIASNLVPADTNGHSDVFVHDRQTGLTERVSISTGGVEGNLDSQHPVISGDGRYVVFESDATNLVAGDTNGHRDVFIRDRLTGMTEWVSHTINGVQPDGDSRWSTISPDGRFVAFESTATNLVPGDTNGISDVFIRDRQAGTTERVSVDSNGTQGNAASYGASISPDGRYVAFTSDANNLVAGDTYGMTDVFVRDRVAGSTERVSLTNSGSQAFGVSMYPAISADGRYVEFESTASLVPSDGNLYWDVYQRDRLLGTTTRLSVPTFGTDQPNGDSLGSSNDATGRIVSFASYASNLISIDTNQTADVFVRDLDSAHFTSYCDPGVGGTVACPCGNPPSGPDTGCDNSSHTGGAALTASNIPYNSNSSIAYLSMDYLFLTASGEKPNALSVLMQGTAANHSGNLFGQGVRCVSGNLKRLYTKAATAGTITFPDVHNPNDVPLSWRSYVLGDPIQPGQPRYYMVYYRDPIVLGGCPLTSTFNSTQSSAVVWYP